MISDIHGGSSVLFSTNLASWETSAKTISGRSRRGHPGGTTKIVQTKSVDISSEYLLRTNSQLLEIDIKIMSSFLQAGKDFVHFQHDY